MENQEEQQEEAGGGFQVQQLRGYLDFARQAIRKKWLTVAITFTIGASLTILAAVYWPRTFSCQTALMTLGTPVLDGQNSTNSALAGAEDLVMRHENLEAIIRETKLVENEAARRPPILRLKDRISRAISAPLSDRIKIASMVGTLETKITVTAEKGDLTIKVDWTDPKTAAELAAAARDSFLRARHTAEISAFEEKMAILDGHAKTLRNDIGDYAGQLKAVRDEKYNEVRAAQAKANKDSAAAAAAAVAAQPRIVRPRAIAPDTQTPELKVRLEALKAKLGTAEGDREARLRAEQAKLDELKLKLTANHPQVVTQAEKVAILGQIPSEVALMRSEVKELQAEISQREGMGRSGGDPLSVGGVGGVRVAANTPEILPPDITDLLQRDNLDPALTAQLSGTVMKYARLRDDLLTTRIELDTAQAAFNHRYQVIVPAEPPTKPSKPKPALIVTAGLVLSLLLALALPIASELRKGVIVERWQVEHLQLPVLAELRLPPYSPD